MATTPDTTTPEPFTFGELYDLKVAAIRQVKEAQKNLKRLHKSGGHTAATTNAIERWDEVNTTYDALIERVQEFIHIKLVENDMVKMAHFRSAAKAFDAQGNHTGPGEWLTLIHEVNRIAAEEGRERIFGAPESTGDWWAGGYVEEYPDARVLHREDESVSVTSKSNLGARLIRQAAERKGWHVDG
jgi:hypothetical protein